MKNSNDKDTIATLSDEELFSFRKFLKSASFAHTYGVATRDDRKAAEDNRLLTLVNEEIKKRREENGDNK